MTYDEGFAAGMRRAAQILNERAANFPVGHEQPTRGASSYNWFRHCADAILAAIPASAPAQCCMCGKRGLSTIEDGGPECELHDGRWVCSSECYDRAIPPAAPWAPPPDAERPGDVVAWQYRVKIDGAWSSWRVSDHYRSPSKAIEQRPLYLAHPTLEGTP